MRGEEEVAGKSGGPLREKKRASGGPMAGMAE